MIRHRRGAVQSSERLDLANIRHPWERVVFWLSVLANVSVIACAATLIYFVPEWLSTHARVSALVDRIRLAAIPVLLLLPLIGVLRHGHWAAFRENSVRLERDQVPSIFSILERHCQTLGVDPPELYASTLKRVELSTALQFTRGRQIIVLGPGLFAGLKRIHDRADVLAFVLASELGRLALGHANWWMDLVLGYLKRIPLLRAPLLTVQTASRDRFAATLSPEGIRALVLAAVGGDLLDHVDTAKFIRQALRADTPPFWAWVGKLGLDGPPIAQRVRSLHRAGFLRGQRDADFASGFDDALAAGHGSTESVDEPRHTPTSH